MRMPRGGQRRPGALTSEKSYFTSTILLIAEYGPAFSV